MIKNLKNVLGVIASVLVGTFICIFFIKAWT